MLNYLMVALGGAIGASARYFATNITAANWGTSFPWGTFFVNTTGSFVIGILFSYFSVKGSGTEQYKLLLITGVLGGYTTFSSFSLDAIELINRDAWGSALIYIGSSVILSLIAAGLGLVLGRSLF